MNELLTDKSVSVVQDAELREITREVTELIAGIHGGEYDTVMRRAQRLLRAAPDGASEELINASRQLDGESDIASVAGRGSADIGKGALNATRVDNSLSLDKFGIDKGFLNGYGKRDCKVKEECGAACDPKKRDGRGDESAVDARVGRLYKKITRVTDMITRSISDALDGGDGRGVSVEERVLRIKRLRVAVFTAFAVFLKLEPIGSADIWFEKQGDEFVVFMSAEGFADAGGCVYRVSELLLGALGASCVLEEVQGKPCFTVRISERGEYLTEVRRPEDGEKTTE